MKKFVSIVFIFGLAFIMVGCNVTVGDYDVHLGGLFNSCGNQNEIVGVFRMHSHPDCDEPLEAMVGATIERLKEMLNVQGFRRGRIAREEGTTYLRVYLSNVPSENDPVETLRQLGNPIQIEIRISGETIIIGSDIISAFATIQPPNDHVVSVIFNERGTAAFANATQNIGEIIEIWMISAGWSDDRVEFLVTTLTIQSQITTGQAVITGTGSPERANEAAMAINAGRLPLMLELTEIDVVNN